MVPASLSLVRVLRYHHAVANPPTRTEAAAIAPSLSQPEARSLFGSISAEVEDSKSIILTPVAFRPLNCVCLAKASLPVLDAC